MKSTEESQTMLPNDKLVPLESVLCTDELNRRPTRHPNYEIENRALVSLVQVLAESPRTILQALADTILEILQAGSAGISLLTQDTKTFYWPAIAGAWKPHIGEGTPRDFGPCGDVLDRNVPLMFKHLERRYTYFQPVTPLVEEALLVPFYVSGKAVGTVWAVNHDDRRRFDAEDLRQLVSLGNFASAAHQGAVALDALEQQGERLRKHQTDLSQLYAANTEARDSRRAINLMEGAVRSREALETLNLELRDSEERYRTLFDLGPIAVYSCDAAGVIRDFNRRAVELWGRKPKPGDSDERWCGSFKLLRPDGSFMPHQQCPMAEVLAGKISEVHDTEVQIERPDGSRVTVIVNIRPLKNERREITGAINCFVDITERKQAEKARAQLAAIVQSSDDAMISKSLDGTITSWNKGAERLFGYTAEEAIGQNIILIVPPDRRDEEAAILQRLPRGERVEHFETIRLRKDGTMFDVSLTISPVKDSSGRVVGASKVARNISEKKAAEKALKQAHDRLESIVEQRTASVRRLSLRLLTVQDEEHRSISRELHDSVGQHLAGIKMTVDRLQQLGPDKQPEMLPQLSESLDKCMSEIRTISYLLHPPLIDEVGFRAAAKWYIEGFSERSGIKASLESSNESQRLPRSIELPLFRILQASLSNVHRHAHSPSVDVRFAINAGEAKLEVKDYGKGIDQETLAHFNRSAAGAGIGLAGMRERLRELGGRLEVESDASGTLIRALIPVSASTEANKAGSAA
jgi:PAS domain S-box-containing protein